MGAAFHLAGVHQQVGALHVPACGLVAHSAQVAVVGVNGGCSAGLVAQVRVQRCANVVEQDVGMR